MADPITGVEFSGSAERSGSPIASRLGCGSLLALLVVTAALFVVGVWASVAWWFLVHGWNLFDL